MIKRFIVLLVSAAAVASCVRDNPVVEDDKPVEIKLRAGASPTRAVVGPNGDLEFTPTIMGWEAPQGEADYGSEGTWHTEPAAPIPHTVSGHPLALLEPQYYNEDRTVYTHIKSWYPKGNSVVNGTLMFDSPLADGTQDVLYATEVRGAKFDPVNAPLTYLHPLIQIKVRVIRETGRPGGLMLKSIVLKDVSLPLGINLANDNLVYDTPTDVTVANTTQEITTTSTYAGVPVMVKPFDGTLIVFDVETNEAFHPSVEANIGDDQTFVPGKAYTITLTFASEEVAAKATIEKWEAGASGGTSID